MTGRAQRMRLQGAVALVEIANFIAAWKGPPARPS
jgi:hypothetical protein